MSPAILTDLSWKVNIGATTRLDGRGKSRKYAGQKPDSSSPPTSLRTKEGISGTLPPPPSLAREEQGRPRRRGRTRQRVRGVGRVRETKTLLASLTYCSHAKIQRDIKSLLHLGPSDRDEELSFTTFDKYADPRDCGTQRGPAGTVDRCPGCIVRQTDSGFIPSSTGKMLRCFKTLWLTLRGDRTGM
jgi:hypothetical protein